MTDAYEVSVDGTYRDLWVYAANANGELSEVTLELLALGRDLVEQHNERYDADENVVAVVPGKEAPRLAARCLEHGADAAYVVDDPKLVPFRPRPHTRVVVAAARHRDGYKDYDLPRYFLFPDTVNGRDLAASAAARLDAGLATGCDAVSVGDVTVEHAVKTHGEETFERVLSMHRDELAGFRRSVLATIDSPNREFHPQCCSIPPGRHEPREPDRDRVQAGRILQVPVKLGSTDTDVEVSRRKTLDRDVDWARATRLVVLGAGLGLAPDRAIEQGLELAEALGAELAFTRRAITAGFTVDDEAEALLDPAREFGARGPDARPDACVIAGARGDRRTLRALQACDTVCAVTDDPDAPVVDHADVHVDADPWEALPGLTDAIRGTGGDDA